MLVVKVFFFQMEVRILDLQGKFEFFGVGYQVCFQKSIQNCLEKVKRFLDIKNVE